MDVEYRENGTRYSVLIHFQGWLSSPKMERKIHKVNSDMGKCRLETILGK